jgi:hypothetical protein
MCGGVTGLTRGVVLWMTGERAIGGGASGDFVSAGGGGRGSGGEGCATGTSGSAGISAGGGGSGIAAGASGSGDTDRGGANTNATACSSGSLGTAGNRTIVSKAAPIATCSSIATLAEIADGRLFDKASGQRAD